MYYQGTGQPISVAEGLYHVHVWVKMLNNNNKIQHIELMVNHILKNGMYGGVLYHVRGTVMPNNRNRYISFLYTVINSSVFSLFAFSLIAMDIFIHSEHTPHTFLFLLIATDICIH